MSLLLVGAKLSAFNAAIRRGWTANKNKKLRAERPQFSHFTAKLCIMHIQCL
jgi:hypothetical protein